MALGGAKLFKELVAAALEYARAEPWKQVGDDEIFSVRIEDEPAPLCASVLGASGLESGLTLFRGERAFDLVREMMATGGDDEAAREALSSLGMTLQPLRDIPAESRATLVRAGFTARREDLAPLFLAKTPGRPPREFNTTEARMFLLALRGVLVAHESGELSTAATERPGGTMLAISVAGHPRDPSVACERVREAGTGDPPASPEDGSPRSDELSREELPAPGDLDAWKSADARVAESLVRLVKAGKILNPRVVVTYFGKKSAPDVDSNEAAATAMFGALIEWAATSCRPVRGMGSLVERLLEKPKLAPADRAVLEARRDARVGLFRIDAAIPRLSVESVDILTGEHFTIHDRSMSASVTIGSVVPLRLLEVGSFRFACVAGPPLGPAQLPGALRMLEAEGLEMSRDGLERAPHLLGRLWRFWFDDVERHSARSARPRLANTDGEDLVWHSASFSVEDESATRAALESREDVHATEEDYGWVRPGAGMGGGNLSLGRFSFVGGDLVVDVNSAERLARATQILEAIPGVRRRNVTRREISGREDDSPLDDRMGPERPAPEGPEVDAVIQEHITKHYLKWIDEPLPMLDGVTPRDRCGTPAGRREVAALIRSIPAIPRPGGRSIEPPREEMLARLGLGDHETSR